VRGSGCSSADAVPRPAATSALLAPVLRQPLLGVCTATPVRMGTLSARAPPLPRHAISPAHACLPAFIPGPQAWPPPSWSPATATFGRGASTPTSGPTGNGELGGQGLRGGGGRGRGARARARMRKHSEKGVHTCY
jgi:hypothetical protein